MTALFTLPAPSPWERVIDVRVHGQGFVAKQTESGASWDVLERPNALHAGWQNPGAARWGGNLLWTGSMPGRMLAMRARRGTFFGDLDVGASGEHAYQFHFIYNGVYRTGGLARVVGVGLKTYTNLPVTIDGYVGQGDGALTLQTPATNADTKSGAYKVRCVSADPPLFGVYREDGRAVGLAEASAAGEPPALFDGELRFTLQVGLVDFAVGDEWTISAEESLQIITITENESTKYCYVVRQAASDPNANRVFLLTLPPETWHPREVFPAPQPWFINASGTRAIASKWVDEVTDAGGNVIEEGFFIEREINLDTLAMTEEAQTNPHYGYTRTSTTVSDDATQTTWDSSDSGSFPVLAEATISRYFDGDEEVPVILRCTYSRSMDATYTEQKQTSGHSYSQSLNEARTIDLLIGQGGSRLAVNLLSYTHSHSESANYPGGAYAHSSASDYVERSVRMTLDDWSHVLTVSQSYTETANGLSDGSTIQTSKDTVSAGSIDGSPLWSNASSENGNADYNFIGATGDFSQIISLPILRDFGGLGIVEMGGPVYVFNDDGYATYIPSNTAGRQTPFAVSAHDERGNWIMVVPTPSGTVYESGGPDGLTPATLDAAWGPASDAHNLGVF